MWQSSNPNIRRWRFFHFLDSHYCPPARDKSIGLQETASYPRCFNSVSAGAHSSSHGQSTDVDLESPGVHVSLPEIQYASLFLTIVYVKVSYIRTCLTMDGDLSTFGYHGHWPLVTVEMARSVSFCPSSKNFLEKKRRSRHHCLS